MNFTRKIPSLSLGLLLVAVGAHAQTETVGLKNFREILASMEESTGISSKTGSIPAIYRKVSSRLPVNGQIEELGSPTVLAQVELAGAFCGELITKESKQDVSDRRFFYRVDFAKGQDQFNPALWTQLGSDFATAFWERTPNADEAGNFKTLLATYQKEPVNAAGTKQTLQALCVQAASSLSFLTNGI